MAAIADTPAPRTSIILARASTAFAVAFASVLVLLHFENRIRPLLAHDQRVRVGSVWLDDETCILRLGCKRPAVDLSSVAVPFDNGWPYWPLLDAADRGGVFGAGIFKPNPITETASNLPNALHTLCGAIVILTFPIASSLVGRSQAERTNFSSV